MLIDFSKMMEKDVPISSFGQIQIRPKTIIMISGSSLVGKTVTCLHISDEVIRNNKKVLYCESEEKSIMTRPEPNLFKTFYDKNKELYDNNFLYSTKLDEEEFFKCLQEQKPELVIIDSIYQPFLAKYKDPRSIAKKIKDFLTKLRSSVWENNHACIITTPIGRIVNPKTGDEQYKPLGGDGLKYLSDSKIAIDFFENDKEEGSLATKRIFTVDKQYRLTFKIEVGGGLELLNKEVQYGGIRIRIKEEETDGRNNNAANTGATQEARTTQKEPTMN
jgi:hypothetical protein